MEQKIHITLRFNLATGKANLNEIVYESWLSADPVAWHIALRGVVGQLHLGLFPADSPVVPMCDINLRDGLRNHRVFEKPSEYQATAPGSTPIKPKSELLVGLQVTVHGQ